MIWSVLTSLGWQVGDRAGDDGDWLHVLLLPGADVDEMALDGGGGGHRRGRRWVRPPGPWRPSKLRLQVGATLAGASLSGFMARHMQQPALRQSAPASRKTRSSPSASAWCADLLAARHDHRPDAVADAAAAEDAGRGAQVLDPAVGARADEDDVDADLLIGVPAVEAHVASARSASSRVEKGTLTRGGTRR